MANMTREDWHEVIGNLGKLVRETLFADDSMTPLGNQCNIADVIVSLMQSFRTMGIEPLMFKYDVDQQTGREKEIRVETMPEAIVTVALAIKHIAEAGHHIAHSIHGLECVERERNKLLHKSNLIQKEEWDELDELDEIEEQKDCGQLCDEMLWDYPCNEDDDDEDDSRPGPGIVPPEGCDPNLN